MHLGFFNISVASYRNTFFGTTKRYRNERLLVNEVPTFFRTSCYELFFIMSTGKDVDYLKNKINIVLESFLSRQRTKSLIHRLLTFKTPCGQRFVFTGM